MTTLDRLRHANNTPFLHFLRNNGLAKAKELTRSAVSGHPPTGYEVEDGVFIVAAAAEIEDALIPFVKSLNWDSAIGSGRTFVRNQENLGWCPFCMSNLSYSEDDRRVLCINRECRLSEGIPTGIYWELNDMLSHIDPATIAWVRMVVKRFKNHGTTHF